MNIPSTTWKPLQARLAPQTSDLISTPSSCDRITLTKFSLIRKRRNQEASLKTSTLQSTHPSKLTTPKTSNQRTGLMKRKLQIQKPQNLTTGMKMPLEKLKTQETPNQKAGKTTNHFKSRIQTRRSQTTGIRKMMANGKHLSSTTQNAPLDVEIGSQQ